MERNRMNKVQIVTGKAKKPDSIHFRNKRVSRSNRFFVALFFLAFTHMDALNERLTLNA